MLISASGDATNFPASEANEIYQVSTAGWLGGGEGIGLWVNEGDRLLCTTTTGAGTKAQVWQNWNISRHETSEPDGYRGIDMEPNTDDVVQSYGTFMKADGLYVTINGTAHKLAVVS
jgi:hypothetical protein